jgi:hypothetical protein
MMMLLRLLTITLLLLLSACYSQRLETAEPTASPAQSLTLAPTIVAAADLLAANVNPLTGRFITDAALPTRRPLVVKISNAPPLVRPQAGIGAADVVFEHYVEGGLTRFSAVYYSQAPQRVGSIRSARLIDLELVPLFDALFAYSGTSEGVGARLSSTAFYPRTYLGVAYPAPYYYRDESIAAPHNLFVNVAALYDLAAQEGYAQRSSFGGFTFGAPPSVSNGAATTLEVRYRATTAGWLYDAARGAYLRYSDGQPHTDANTGVQVAAENVLILYASHRETDIVESVWQEVISWSLEIMLWGEGEAVLVRDGQHYAARWSRAQGEATLRLTTPDGAPLALKPGVTWVQMFPPPGEQQGGEGVRL